MALCDTSNLCGALEFAEKISKVGTQPIIGTQINFKFGDTIGLLPLFSLNEKGYKRIIKLSSLSFLENDELSDPHVDFNNLLENNEGVAIFSGTIFGLFGELFNKGKFSEIHDLYEKLNSTFGDRFYIEIQRHNDQNELGFEKFNLNKSLQLKIPIIATNEVFYINQDMHEAHDALICIGNKTYINEKNRKRLSDQHYFKSNSEMSELFADLPEALENNYNFPLRCNFRPLFSNPILPNISSEKGGNADDLLKKDSLNGLKVKFNKINPYEFLFGEDQARYLIACEFDQAESLFVEAGKQNIPIQTVGSFKGDTIIFGNSKSDMASLSSFFTDTFKNLFQN